MRWMATLAGLSVLAVPVISNAQSGDSPGPTPAPDRTLQGDAVCTKCHDESEAKPILSMYRTPHGVKADARTPGCQGCHGASEAHVKNIGGTAERRAMVDVVFGRGADASPAPVQSQVCLNCHQGGLRMNWAGSQHQSRDVPCAACHTVHAAHDPVLSKITQQPVCFTCHKEQRAQALRISTHPLAAGKMGCADCHNPHGSAGPKLLAKNTVNETCYTCHAEKRGPFLWEHPPATDDCLNCHTPHGSTSSPLLKARTPWLCQQCHGDGAPHPGQVYSAANLPDGTASNNNINPGAGASAINPITGTRITRNNPEPRLAFRACLNCHSQVHGSNHPGGNRFLR